MGERIGDYEIESELGVGGMATVYKARHAILDTHHAIKVLDPKYRSNADARQRFLEEAKLQAKHLDHPNIVKVTNIVATAEHAALVMELIDGPSLESKIDELKKDPDELKRIMFGILDGVGYAHEAGVIHRDLKPANVLLARSKGGPLIPKVTDFGIAKVTDAAQGKRGKKSTHADARMGTLHYMSPEQVRKSKDVTPRSDVFSLGVMLFEMATGDVPFGGDSDYDMMENITHGRYELPAGLDPVIAKVIAKALESDPAQRFASCAEMADMLRGDGAVADLPPPTPIKKTQASGRRGRVVPLAIVGALLVGGGGVAFVLHRRSATPPAPAELATAEQVIEASLAAQGGRERMSHVTSFRQVGSYLDDSKMTTFTAQRLANDQLVTYVLPDGATVQEGITDGFVWSAFYSKADPTTAVPGVTLGKARAKKVRESSLGSDLLRWKQDYPAARLDGIVTFASVPAYKVVLTADAEAKTWYIATATLMEIGASSLTLDGKTQTTTYFDFRDVGGIKYEHAYTTTIGTPGSLMTKLEFTIKTIELNPPLSPAVFDVPMAVRQMPPQFDPDKTYAVSVMDGSIVGVSDAKITIVIVCPGCEKATSIIAAIRDKYGSDVRIVYKAFAVPPDEETLAFYKGDDVRARSAMNGRNLARCAAARQGKLTELDVRLSENGFDDSPTLESGAAVGFAEALKLDTGMFKKDLASCVDVVDRSTAELTALEGSEGVPTQVVFINGRAPSRGQRLETLTALIDEELKVVDARIQQGTLRKNYYQEWVLDRGEKHATPLVIPPPRGRAPSVPELRGSGSGGPPPSTGSGGPPPGIDIDGASQQPAPGSGVPQPAHGGIGSGAQQPAPAAGSSPTGAGSGARRPSGGMIDL